ncbi:Protein of Unknown Function (DUF239) [Abeliophyllum distichum]|uniref:Neprosin PEP catalytic domain-containing protein n=1 Tax=Abeliophyllum distichum TaxID=126358 RepID=A0ABD1TYL9_9LAMI
MSPNSGRKENSQKSHAIRSIQSEDGDIIDCIHIYKQPSLDHPSLRNHKIQPQERARNHLLKEIGGSPETLTTQLWQRSGSCPEGTIPIRRIDKNNGTKGDLGENYGRKKPMAILLTAGYAYLGAKGDIKVCSPQVELDDEYSTSRVSLSSGPQYEYEVIEAGWAVNPSVYGDRQTRLFVYWTVDGSKKTGCFDLTCPGFIQTSNKIALGTAIYPISNPTGLPYQITVYIHKDPNTNNWWVQYGETINIGYWPSDLFDLLKYHAESVEWGGEVYSSRVGTHPHTATGMGSGKFSDYITESSGYIKRMRILGNNLELKFPEWIYTYSDEYDCYDVFYLGDYVEDPEFYYGGPGRNPKCP